MGSPKPSKAGLQVLNLSIHKREICMIWHLKKPKSKGNSETKRCKKFWVSKFNSRCFCQKVEIVMEDPVLFIFYDVITDKEIEMMKKKSPKTVKYFY